MARSFTLELTEAELKYIYLSLGERTQDDDKKIGLDPCLGTAIYYGIEEVLDF